MKYALRSQQSSDTCNHSTSTSTLHNCPSCRCPRNPSFLKPQAFRIPQPMPINNNLNDSYSSFNGGQAAKNSIYFCKTTDFTAATEKTRNQLFRSHIFQNRTTRDNSDTKSTSKNITFTYISPNKQRHVSTDARFSTKQFKQKHFPFLEQRNGTQSIIVKDNPYYTTYNQSSPPKKHKILRLDRSKPKSKLKTISSQSQLSHRDSANGSTVRTKNKQREVLQQRESVKQRETVKQREILKQREGVNQREAVRQREARQREAVRQREAARQREARQREAVRQKEVARQLEALKQREIVHQREIVKQRHITKQSQQLKNEVQCHRITPINALWQKVEHEENSLKNIAEAMRTPKVEVQRPSIQQVQFQKSKPSSEQRLQLHEPKLSSNKQLNCNFAQSNLIYSKPQPWQSVEQIPCLTFDLQHLAGVNYQRAQSENILVGNIDGKLGWKEKSIKVSQEMELRKEEEMELGEQLSEELELNFDYYCPRSDYYVPKTESDRSVSMSVSLY